MCIETKNKMYLTNTAILQLDLVVKYKQTFSILLTTEVTFNPYHPKCFKPFYQNKM